MQFIYICAHTTPAFLFAGSPSRATFMTGRHAIHHGIYMPFTQGTGDHLSLNFTLLPAYLKTCCNYSTHLSGKWHLGQATIAQLPTSRGFDSHLGYLSGAEDHVTHVAASSYGSAYDFVDGQQVAPQYNGTFGMYGFMQRATELISAYGGPSPPQQPLFLYLAFQDVHWPLQAPQEYVDRFPLHVVGNNSARQMVCAMASFLDDAVGNVTAALKAAGIWDDTLVIAVSDNGGPENGNEGTQSNNYPMRGGKNTLWEGGTRVVGLVRGAGIQPSQQGTVSYEKIHATDWLPTLVSMASGQNWTNFIPPGEPPYLLGDGLNVWPTLSTGSPSPRDWLLLETHPAGASNRVHGDALIVDNMKILKYNVTNPQEENGWYPPPGQDPSKVTYLINCPPTPSKQPDPEQCHTKFCLFNITADPCEHEDMSDKYPDIVQQLEARLAEFQATAVPPEVPTGCNPVIAHLPNGAPYWRPCDAPQQLFAAV